MSRASKPARQKTMTLGPHEFIRRFLIHERLAPVCPCCGGRMVIIETFKRGATPGYHASVPTRIVRIDTS